MADKKQRHEWTLLDDLMRLFVDWFSEDNPWGLINGFLMMFVEIEDTNWLSLQKITDLNYPMLVAQT